MCFVIMRKSQVKDMWAMWLKIREQEDIIKRQQNTIREQAGEIVRWQGETHRANAELQRLVNYREEIANGTKTG